MLLKMGAKNMATTKPQPSTNAVMPAEREGKMAGGSSNINNSRRVCVYAVLSRNQPALVWPTLTAVLTDQDSITICGNRSNQ
jgi:hypothetical protein